MRLARRLRLLRQAHWPDRRLTQPQLGGVLGVGAPSISAWESGKAAPPPSRLAAYATFFATRRSLDGDGGPRLLQPDDLTEEERRVRDELAAELSTLAEPGERPVGPWHFPDGQPVRLICSRIERQPLRAKDFASEDEERETPRSKYASGDELNYMQLMAYADLDSMVDVFGHVRAQNPRTDVRFDLTKRGEPDDLQNHVVILGGLGGAAGRSLARAGVPVSQVRDPDEPPWADEGEIFEAPMGAGQYFRPTLNRHGALIEDVGLFVRVPSPYHATATLTVVSGVFTRGVYGAARLFTHDLVRERNEHALAEMFPNSSAYALLVRVLVEEHITFTPDLTVPGSVLWTWSRD